MAFSYDATVFAGINCKFISVEKDDDKREIIITLPPATIMSVDIDFDSFQKLEEKQGLWSRIKSEDVNKAIGEYKKSVTDRAVEKGILTKANENAEAVITGLVKQLIDIDDYEIRYVHK